MALSAKIDFGTHEGSILRDGLRRTPKGFGRMPMKREHNAFATEMAVSTFTDMINHGHSFQVALTAIYLTGIDHALNAKEDGQDR